MSVAKFLTDKRILAIYITILKVTQLCSRNNCYLTVISMLWTEITGKNIYGNSHFYGKSPGSNVAKEKP